MTSDSSAAPEGVQKVAELAKGTTFAMLTTLDETGAFVSRPMAQQDTDFDGDLWFLSSRGSRSVAHIRANPRVGVALTSRDVWISVSDTVEVLDEAPRPRSCGPRRWRAGSRRARTTRRSW